MATFIWRGQWGQIGVAIASMSGVFLYQGSTMAQIVPDGTLGTESSVVTPNLDIKGVPSDRIDAGAIRGTNLFHSFQEFNVEAGRGVYFSNPTGIENILTRVTGGNVSNIFGRLGVLGKANLFLLNPNGIIFGPGASLDLSGSFVGSTGNSLNFGDGIEFSATNPAAPPLLRVSVPLGVQFPQEQPRAIVNAGNLAVEMGQNLTLLGGTVVSTGQLSALGGQVAVAAVPSGAVVNLSPSAQLLRIDTPSPVAGVGASESLSPSSATLAELLIGKDGEINVPLRVNSNGQVELVGSGLPVTIVDGDVVAQNVMAQTATLSAYRNLTLVESQLSTMGDLNLLARDTVRVRDSATKPFVAQAGGRLLVQGNQGVDIFALNHPYSGLVSGGDMVLRSANTVGGDAHYWTGGSFRIEKLDGSLGGLFSPYDPIIRARGDVSFESYTGGSLHIFAGGSVTISGTVEITDVDETNGLIESKVPLSDGTLINIDGKNSPTLDIRAGTTAFNPEGLPPNIIREIPDLMTSDNEPTRADITIGSIENLSGEESNSGQIFLTNQYKFNALPGSITIGKEGISTYGNVTIDSRGDITTNGVIDTRIIDQTTSNRTSGEIRLIANQNIKLNSNLESNVEYDVEEPESPESGNGGKITLISKFGEIDTTGVTIESTSRNGLAGDVTLMAAGDIRSGDIKSKSSSNDESGDFREITLKSQQGSIFLNKASLTATNTGSGYAGNIDIYAENSQVEISGSNIISNGVLGVINITSKGNVSITDSTLKTETKSDLTGENDYNEINIKSNQGSIFLNGARLSSTNTGAGYAGQIAIYANNSKVEITDSQIISNGYLGAIAIVSGGNLSITDSTLKADISNSLPPPTVQRNTSKVDPSIGRFFNVDNKPSAGFIFIYSLEENITITASSVSASTESQQALGGNMFILAEKSVFLSGNNSAFDFIESKPTLGIFTKATQGAIAGNIFIGTNSELAVKNGAAIEASSPDGKAGSVIILAEKISLNNAAILAETGSPDRGSGNIFLLGNQSNEETIPNLISQISTNQLGNQPLPGSPLESLILKNESLIRANANSKADAGNITIQTRLLLAFPPTGEKGSDISANAEGGAGGRVVIEARPLGIYNIEFREKPTPLNDITASSDSGPAGIVTITPPDVDPRTGLIQLPENLADSANLIAQSCLIGGQRAASRFVITGRGGLPSNPSSALSSETLLGDAASTPPPENSSNSTSSTDSGSDSPVEAQGVKIGPNGEIVLTAHPSNYTPYSSWQKVGGCNEQ